MEDQTNGQQNAPFGDVPKISESLASLQTELENLKSATQHIEESKEAAREAASAAERVPSATESLTSSTESLLNRIDAADFPERIERIEWLLKVAIATPLAVGALLLLAMILL